MFDANSWLIEVLFTLDQLMDLIEDAMHHIYRQSYSFAQA